MVYWSGYRLLRGAWIKLSCSCEEYIRIDRLHYRLSVRFVSILYAFTPVPVLKLAAVVLLCNFSGQVSEVCIISFFAWHCLRSDELVSVSLDLHFLEWRITCFKSALVSILWVAEFVRAVVTVWVTRIPTVLIASSLHMSLQAGLVRRQVGVILGLVTCNIAGVISPCTLVILDSNCKVTIHVFRMVRAGQVSVDVGPFARVYLVTKLRRFA